MRVLVVDASVLVAAVSDQGSEGPWAERVLADGQLVVPAVALVEAVNILRRMEAGRLLSADAAETARQDLLDLDLEIFPFSPFADRIWALRHNLTCYDAWYVAVAEAISAPLATLDRRLAAAPGPRCSFELPD